MVNENLQVLGRIDLAHLKRRDNDVLNLPRLHPIEEFLVELQNRKTGYFETMLAVGDESHGPIRRIAGRSQHLGYRDTGIFGPENQHAGTAVAVLLQYFAEGLHGYAQREEQHEGDRHINDHERIKNRMMSSAPIHHIIEKHNHNAGR